MKDFVARIEWKMEAASAAVLPPGASKAWNTSLSTSAMSEVI